MKIGSSSFPFNTATRGGASLRRWICPGVVLVLLLLIAPSTARAASRVERVSIGSGGVQGNGPSRSSGGRPAISADGRYVVFVSVAGNLVAGDTNGVSDVFLRDRLAGHTERVSVSSTGAQADGESSAPSISADGRFVAFASSADNLVPGDTNGQADIFVRDRTTGKTERVSVASDGTPARQPSYFPIISASGRFVAFSSYARHLAGDPGGLDGGSNLAAFLRDRAAGTTERIGLTPSGEPITGSNFAWSISADGRTVAFTALGLVVADGGFDIDGDVYVRDRLQGTTLAVNRALDGSPGNNPSYSPSLSADGRYVAFVSSASNLVPGGRRRSADVYVRDLVNGKMERVDGSLLEWSGNVHTTPVLSADGRYVAYASARELPIPGDLVPMTIFVWDRMTGVSELASPNSGRDQSVGFYVNPSLSADGRFVVFTSDSIHLVPADTNRALDVFVADRAAVAPTRIAVFRPATREWFLREEDGTATVEPFGGPADQPVIADLLATGNAAVGVFRRSTGHWFFLTRTTLGANLDPISFGRAGDVPVPADYLGLRHAQMAVYTPAAGEWRIRDGGGNVIGPIPLGGPGDVPVPADYLGLGRAQLAVFRPGTRRITLLPAAAWFLRTDAGATIGPLLFGQSGDVPVPGDYLGLGHAQIAVFRPRTGEWLIRTDAGRAVHIALGKSGDVPVPGDYAGTGRLQIAIYRPTTGEWFRRAASGAVTRVQWGAPGDLPVPAPYPREFGIRAVVDYFDPPD